MAKQVILDGLDEKLIRAFPGRVVIGNGDVRVPEDAARIVAETGCDSVMIGRAALGNPWIFAEAKRSAMAATGGGPGAVRPGPDPEARKALILRHGEEMHRRNGDRGIREMRKHLAWYSRGIPGAAAFRGRLVGVRTLAELREAVERFF